MIVLGIETATALCGTGLAGDSGLIADYRLIRGHAHAERLAGAVEKVLADADLRPQDLAGIAVSIGPGSFTGLRIGLAFAKGLAFAHDLPLLAVPTFTGLVSSLPPIAPAACVLIVSRKGEVYRGLYLWRDPGWGMEGDVKVLPEESLCEGLPDGRIVFLGPGVPVHRERIASCGRAVFLESGYLWPSGYGVAEAGRRMLARGETADTDGLVPLYLKRFQGVD